MPVVTKLVTQRRGDFINLYVDDEFYCGLSLNQVAAWRLHKGQELALEQLNELQAEAAESKTYGAAIRYLALRIRSTQEVRDYLKRKGFEATSDKVIERLIGEGYLDDKDFVQRWSEMRRQMLWSPRAIQGELMRKGIAKHLIDDCIEYDEVDGVIKQLIVKKNRHHMYNREKLMRYLMSKGFSYSDIKPHLDRLDSQ